MNHLFFRCLHNQNQRGSNHIKPERLLTSLKDLTEVKDKTKRLNQNKIVYRGKKWVEQRYAMLLQRTRKQGGVY